jgi:PAS domain S-box-containing protein
MGKNESIRMASVNSGISRQNLSLIKPPALQEWRERLLNGILRGMFIFWLIALIGSINGVIQASRQQGYSPFTTAVIAVYLAAAVLVTIITFWRELGFGLRAGVMLFLLYTMGVIGLALGGLSGNGRMFLFTFITMTVILSDLRRSIGALVLSILTMGAIAWLLIAGQLQIPLMFQANATNLAAWFNESIIFVLLSVAVIISVTYLIYSLDRSLVASQKERNIVTAIFETGGALMVMFDPEGRIVHFNGACEQLTGYSFDEVKDQYIWDLFLTPEGVDLIRLVFDQLKTGRQPSVYESYWLTRTGARRLIAWSSTTLRDSNGVVESIISTGIDITEHKQAEAERERLLVAEREQRLQTETLAEVSLALTSQTSPAAVLDEILRQVQRIIPYKAANISLLEGDSLRVVRWQGYETFGGEEVISDLLQPLAAFPLNANAVTSRRPIVVQNTRQEPRWIRMEGLLWIRSHLVVPIVLQERVLGLLRLDGSNPGEFSAQNAERLQPLTNAAAIALENARLHQETRRQAHRVRQILDTAQDGILLLDSRYRLELANPAAQAYLAMLTKARVDEVLTQLGGTSLTKLLEPRAEGMPWHELTVKKQRRTFEAAARPIEGGPEGSGWVLILRDVTEARQQQRYLQAQERLAMVGQIAAGIAHDFNNIMAVIILYADMLLKKQGLPATLQQPLQTIFQQARQAANLISQILDFSRQSVVERRPVDVLPFLKELAKLLKRTLPENITIRLEHDEGQYVVSGDLTRLQQAIMNLAVNARDAMPEGGTLRLELSHLLLEAGEKPPLPDMCPGDWLVLNVIDTGAGIAPRDLPHIFEPFFTTKAPGRGTGLGLAQVYGIIKQHDGHIDVASQVRQGTRFAIYLPAHAMPESQEVEPVIEAPTRGGGETILVAEDNQMTRKAVRDVLEMLDYHVLEAADGQEALQLFEQHDDIALVLSDMVMPSVGGSVLYARLKEKKPDIKMVVITGYPFEEHDKALLSQGIVAWVQKPFEVGQISQAIREALAS